MAFAVTYLLGLFGVLQAVSAAPAAACKLQWGGATIDGHLGANNVCRYNIKYAQAERWGESAAVPTHGDAWTLPPSCPQPGVPGLIDGVPQSEDCLHMLAYVPQGASADTPIFTWLHGGSNAIGGAAQAGIDASALAAKGQVVVVPQFRLGLFGMLPPASSPAAADPNLAVRDVVLALKSVRDNIGTGDTGAVTVGGHSTGATLIRALWAAPSAEGLFHRMILQSDPSGFSLSTKAQYETVRSKVYNFPSLAGKSLAELKALSTSVLADASIQLQASYHPAPYAHDVVNPVFGTATIPKDPFKALTSSPGSLTVKPKQVPLFITSTKDEAATTVGYGFPTDADETPGSYYEGNAYELGLSMMRCAGSVSPVLAIKNRDQYEYDSIPGPDRTRNLLTRVVTDGLWRCPARTVASAWAKNGGKVYVAEFNKAAPSYIYGKEVAFCSGKVCHGNDVPVVFGTDNTLGDEVTNYWSTFIQGGDLNWNTYSANANQKSTNIKAIGGGDLHDCPTNFWGNECKFLWQ